MPESSLLHGTLDALILKTLAGGARHGYGIARYLEDATSGKVVWRGHAEGVPRYGPKEIAAQIDAAVVDLRGRYPPGH